MYSMFKFVLLRVPLLNIQMLRTCREIRTCQYYMHVIYIQIYIYKLYQLYEEIQAHIRFHSPL